MDTLKWIPFITGRMIGSSTYIDPDRRLWTVVSQDGSSTYIDPDCYEQLYICVALDISIFACELATFRQIHICVLTLVLRRCSPNLSAILSIFSWSKRKLFFLVARRVLNPAAPSPRRVINISRLGVPDPRPTYNVQCTWGIQKYILQFLLFSLHTLLRSVCSSVSIQ